MVFRNILQAIGAVFVCGSALLFGAALLFALRGDGTSSWFAGDRVAVLPLEGVIVSDEPYVQEIKRFREDPSVRAIVVFIDSPGGAVAPSQSIYQELRKARDMGIPVIASIGSIGASGGYYVALAADSILALPGSVTGSIGVIMEFPNAQELLGKVGVSMEVVKSAEHKDAGSPFRRISDGDRGVLQGMVSDVFEQFVTVVVEERRMPEGTARELADGRLFSGRQAIAAGLVDRAGNLEDAIAVAGRMSGLGDEPAVVLPPPPRRSIAEMILGVRAASLAQRLHAGVEPFQGPRMRYIAH